mmetsp:Transcript_87535/g.245888  ORF Transcript_87535/g.245888 Transcript_87535/m.245888 type:complete len:239 (-) Transcript_87535:34-750(-)
MRRLPPGCRDRPGRDSGVLAGTASMPDLRAEEDDWRDPILRKGTKVQARPLPLLRPTEAQCASHGPLLSLAEQLRWLLQSQALLLVPVVHGNCVKRRAPHPAAHAYRRSLCRRRYGVAAPERCARRAAFFRIDAFLLLPLLAVGEEFDNDRVLRAPWRRGRRLQFAVRHRCARKHAERVGRQRLDMVFANRPTRRRRVVLAATQRRRPRQRWQRRGRLRTPAPTGARVAGRTSAPVDE